MNDMARNNFKRIGDKIRGSGFILYIAAALVVGMLVTVIMGVNDYYTSYRGVGLVPINQTLPNPGALEVFLAEARQVGAAAMPQVITIIAGFILFAFEPLKGNRREWILWFGALTAFVFAIYIDVATGYLYYIQEPYRQMSLLQALSVPGGREAALAALGWSLGVDTLFSEVGMTVFWGLFFEIYPNVMDQWRKVLGAKTPKPGYVPTPQSGNHREKRGRENRQREFGDPGRLP